ncbi:MAG: apolipoprotein N-acyltransferase, partial [Capnocytophaga sp.]|nr:apolipoprotein N-acyltransferase [Capnocytophaga sp.]
SILRQMVAQYPKLNIIGGVAMIDFIEEESKLTPQSNYLEEHGIWYNDYNSAFLLNQNVEIPLYHKSKLVVGVENFPYQSVLKPIFGETLIDLGGTVALKTTQSHRSVFFGSQTSGKAAPIICYESIYGEFVTDYVKNGANFLAILTNDAWWQNTQGHKQLLSYARLRAIETRRSIARSANTGISAFINQRGDVLGSLPYDTQGSLRGTINLNEELTFYTMSGDYLARISYFLSLFVFLYAVARKRKF